MPTHQPAIPEAPQAEVTLPATHGETASSINQGVPAPVVNGAPAIPEQPVPTLHRAAPHAPN
ncbi:MAG: helix-turn-helix domain-containing protein, partial [Armatimonadetes bacterium]|nr:helix-turn-helix domain-containing protein [Armatimonadota bacterium]